MSRFARFIVGIFVAVSLLFVLTVGATTAAVYSAGSVELAVADEGSRPFSFRVPAGLIHLAIMLTPATVLSDAADELEPWMVPAVRAGWKELSRTQDFVLVEVQSDGELVRVHKSGKRLVVEVDAGDGSFEVALPMKTVDRLLSKLERAGS